MSEQELRKSFEKWVTETTYNSIRKVVRREDSSRIYSDPSVNFAWHAWKACAGMTQLHSDIVAVPLYAERERIGAMALRMRHDFGLDRNPDDPLSAGMTASEREVLMTQMRQVYETAVTFKRG